MQKFQKKNLSPNIDCNRVQQRLICYIHDLSHCVVTDSFERTKCWKSNLLVSWHLYHCFMETIAHFPVVLPSASPHSAPGVSAE